MGYEIQKDEYRKAADRMWEMAKEYRNSGQISIAEIFQDLASQLHELARKQEAKNGQS